MTDKPTTPGATASDITVKLDDRIRLMCAVLAATDWPQKTYDRSPHLAHMHARTTVKAMQNYKTHPAAQNMQGLLDQGAPLEALFTFVMYLSWPDLKIDELPKWVPPGWNDHLRDFYKTARVAEFWEKEKEEWDKSLRESEKMFKGRQFKPFLKPFLGDIREELLFVPNIAYPANQELGLRVGGSLVSVTPPRLAWGDSAPWPFDEDAAHIYGAALTQYVRLLLLVYLRSNAGRVAEASESNMPISDEMKARHPTWEDQFIHLFSSGVVAIYLEDHVNEKEAKAYVLMQKKTQGVTVLPGTVSVLRRYLSELESGRYESLLDWLPLFPKQLRVAKRIVSL